MKKSNVPLNADGFIGFIRAQGIVGIATAVLLGGAATKLVDSLIADIINPFIGLLFGGIDKLTDFQFEIYQSVFNIGSFIIVLLNFTIVALLVYLATHYLKIQKLDKKELKK